MNYSDWPEEKVHEKAVWIYGLVREAVPDLPRKQDAVISDMMLCDAYELYQDDFERMAEFIRAVHEGRYRDVNHKRIRAMMDYVDEHQPCSYAKLLSHANDEQLEWFHCLMLPHIGGVMRDYCRTAREDVRYAARIGKENHE